VRAVVTIGIILAVAVVLFGWVIPVLWQKLTGQSPPPRKPRGSYSGEAASQREFLPKRRRKPVPGRPCDGRPLTVCEAGAFAAIRLRYKDEAAEPRRSR
jgi:hypothetical protein